MQGCSGMLNILITLHLTNIGNYELVEKLEFDNGFGQNMTLMLLPYLLLVCLQEIASSFLLMCYQVVASPSGQCNP